MISLYARTDRGVIKSTYKPGNDLPVGTIWIDIDRAERAEVEQLSRLVHCRIPELRDVRLTDQSRQYFIERNNLYVTTPVVVGSHSENPSSGVMMLVLTAQYIITLRKADMRSLNNFADRLAKQPELLHSAPLGFIGLIDAVIDRLADLGEKVSYDMEQVSRLVFVDSLQRSRQPGSGNANTWRKVLQGLGTTARLNHRILDTLSGLDRMILFVQQHAAGRLDATAENRLHPLLSEVKHLTAQAEGRVNEANFLLDAIVGAISIEQNNVIKVFSMVSVILMPPTMVASIYGMNFVHMPELAQVWGYPAALVLMLISAILPWWWFKRNGWF